MEVPCELCYLFRFHVRFEPFITCLMQHLHNTFLVVSRLLREGVSHECLLSQSGPCCLLSALSSACQESVADLLNYAGPFGLRALPWLGPQSGWFAVLPYGYCHATGRRKMLLHHLILLWTTRRGSMLQDLILLFTLLCLWPGAGRETSTPSILGSINW